MVTVPPFVLKTILGAVKIYPLPGLVRVKLLTVAVTASKFTDAVAGVPTYRKLPTTPLVWVGGVVPGAVAKIATYRFPP